MIDPLTGLLNRKALDSRFRELEQQARQSEASVCVIAADLDNFKKVNDAHGHARGDDVLRDVTYEMRKRLRTFELMYRVGGEEFLLVLPGIDLPEGVAVAERLRQAVEECKPAGLDVDDLDGRRGGLRRRGQLRVAARGGRPRPVRRQGLRPQHRARRRA